MERICWWAKSNTWALKMRELSLAGVTESQERRKREVWSRRGNQRIQEWEVLNPTLLALNMNGAIFEELRSNTSPDFLSGNQVPRFYDGKNKKFSPDWAWSAVVPRVARRELSPADPLIIIWWDATLTFY